MEPRPEIPHDAKAADQTKQIVETEELDTKAPTQDNETQTESRLEAELEVAIRSGDTDRAAAAQKAVDDFRLRLDQRYR
jgi:hypothetical protein